LDRYEGLSDLSQETATLRFDYTSLQPEVMMANSLKGKIKIILTHKLEQIIKVFLRF